MDCNVKVRALVLRNSDHIRTMKLHRDNSPGLMVRIHDLRAASRKFKSQ